MNLFSNSKDFSTLGENLKELRNKLGLSLGEVANMTGVSKTMLSQIERCESIPTIATVWKIANGLKIKFDTLLESPIKHYEVNSIDKITPLIDDDGRFLVYCLFPFSPLSGFEYFYGTLKPGCNHTSGNHLNSRAEYLMVTEGEIELIIGEKKYHLSAGCYMEFDSTDNHSYRNSGTKDATVHFVLRYE